MRRRGIGGPGRGIGPAGMAARRMARRRHRRRRRRRIILVGGMVALGASAVHKYSQKDVERIEAQTGKPAEELSDEELQQATQSLGIQPQEMSDAEFDEFDAADTEEDDDEGDAGGGSAGVSSDYIDQLQRLAELRDQGILTDEEFEAKKKQLLGM